MTKAKAREIAAALAAAVGEKDEDTDDGTLTIETITGTLRQVAPGLYQKVFDAEHSERNKRAEKEQQKLQADLDAAKKELDTLKGDGKGSEGGTQTDDQKAARIRELEGQVTRLTAEKTELEGKHKTALAEAKRDVTLESLRALLVGREGDRLEPEYADVLLGTKNLRDRVRVNDDLTVEVLTASGVPYAPGEGKSGLDMLAGDVVEGAKKDKPRLVISNAESGSGTGGNNGRSTGASGGSKDSSFYDGIRKEVVEREKVQTPTGGSAAQRMGLTVVGASGAA
jgi:hypothetical protein